ncbi:hypothetical protein [uncultured Intestinimonas sp.]|uniref:hypothetical protein n=1 Tax=uncultured Intestinimonas sp. TaxID=1689265 RepID=UPI0025F3066C|nr:hypothetical protein [uncultured Intestinimonas sp.]
MRNVKKPALLLCALLLLAGCGGEEPLDWTPTPVTPPPTREASLTEDASWWAGVDVDLLPTEAGSEPYVDGEVTYRVWASAPERELLLYEVRCAPYEGAQYLLRKGEALGEPLRLAEGLPEGRCGLAWGDYDRDGAEEYTLTLTRDTGADLILCELTGEDWTFHTYGPADYSAQLSAALGFSDENGAVTLRYGGTSVTYTLGPAESGPAAPLEDFSRVAFVTPDGDRLSGSFGAGAVIGGENVYFAQVLADVVYDGEGFSLANLRLLSTTGV